MVQFRTSFTLVYSPRSSVPNCGPPSSRDPYALANIVNPAELEAAAAFLGGGLNKFVRLCSSVCSKVDSSRNLQTNQHLMAYQQHIKHQVLP